MTDTVIKNNDICVTIRKDGGFKYEDEGYGFDYKFVVDHLPDTNAEDFSCGQLVDIMKRMEQFAHSDDTFKKESFMTTMPMAIMNAHTKVAYIKDDKCMDSNIYFSNST